MQQEMTIVPRYEGETKDFNTNENLFFFRDYLKVYSLEADFTLRYLSSSACL